MKVFMKFFLMFFMIFSFNIFSQELSKGMKAPDFTLQDENGKKVTLSKVYKKSPVVIFFYPRAMTSGCTKQACGIRDNFSEFEKNNIKVFGISTDSTNKLKEFVKKENLNFPLLSDVDKKVSENYGVLRESGMAKRVTFIIDKKGIVSEIIEVKDIDNHAELVLRLAKELK